MSMSIKRTSFYLVLALFLAAVAIVALWGSVFPNREARAASTPKGEVQIDLVMGLPSGSSVEAIVNNIGSSGEDGFSFNVDSFFDVSYASNIGSSGEDGVTAKSFSVDSFFDIEYEITRTTIPIEIVAMQLHATLPDPSNPGTALDTVIAAVESDGKSKVFYGHVTILK